MVRAVFLDVGEVLFEETGLWGAWADWLGVPRLTFFAVLGQVVERGEHHRRVFEVLAPGRDVAAEEAARVAAGRHRPYQREDLYPDVVACLERLRAAGLRVGLAGNQPVATEAVLRGLGLPADVVGSSEGWGVAKPAAAFFERVVQHAGVPAGAVAYVGDRVDNDVVPAADAGLVAVHLRRGPWGVIQAGRPGAQRAAATIDGLDELPEALQRL